MALYEEIYRKSAICKDLEPVPGDFVIKKTSIDILRHFLKLNGNTLGLEIGCGSGFNAALLSASTSRMVATDLPSYNPESHSLGIAVAQDLIKRLEIENVQILSCSGERLPFFDNTFDFIFSLSVLEHIIDKDAALKEMFRVLKPGGIVIACVPTYLASLYAFMHLYLYIARRTIEVLAAKIFRRPARTTNTLLPKSDDNFRPSSGILDSFRKSHPSFPLPEPHGSYKNILQEFVEQLPWNWTKRIRKCGIDSFETFAVLFLPYNILEIFSTRLIARLYTKTRYLHYIFGRSFLQYFCYSWCIVAKKNKTTNDPRNSDNTLGPWKNSSPYNVK